MNLYYALLSWQFDTHQSLTTSAALFKEDIVMPVYPLLDGVPSNVPSATYKSTKRPESDMLIIDAIAPVF